MLISVGLCVCLLPHLHVCVNMYVHIHRYKPYVHTDSAWEFRLIPSNDIILGNFNICIIDSANPLSSAHHMEALPPTLLSTMRVLDCGQWHLSLHLPTPNLPPNFPSLFCLLTLRLP